MVKKETIVSILLILILITIFIINLKIYLDIIQFKREIEKQHLAEETTINASKEYYNNATFQEIKNNVTYYKVKSCVGNYFNAWKNIWIDEEDEQYYDETDFAIINEQKVNKLWIEYLLGILPQEYKNANDININNITDKYTKIPKGKPVYDKIYEYNVSEKISAYIVIGNYISEEDTNNIEFSVMLIMDRDNSTYEIYPTDYVLKNSINNITIGKKIEWLKNIKSVDDNKSNKFIYNRINDQAVAEDLFEDFMYNAKYNTQRAYDMLNEEYRSKKFNNINEFNNFMMNRLDKKIIGYDVTKEINYSQFVVKDENNNYYIFIQKSPIDYEVFLDIYTTELLEYNKKYQDMDNKNKTAINIQKIIDALNDMDYEFVYSKLADSFKTNYFKTFDDFKKYANETFGINNQITFINFIETNNYCTYEILIKNDEHEITKTIIMDIGEETDFKFSFTI